MRASSAWLNPMRFPRHACRNVLQTLKVVLHEGGTRGLWRGTGPTVVRLAFGAGINFVALENLKHFMLDVLPQGTGQLGYLQAAAVGGEAVTMLSQHLCKRPRQRRTSL
jgi:hypothetical protein